MISNVKTQEALTAAVRKIIAKVELYNGSTLVNTFYHSDKLINFTVERVGESSKFFGFGVLHKINIQLIDRERALNITTDHYFKVYLAAGYEGFIEPFCSKFFVTEVNRDENTNALSITAYDALNKAAAHTVAELALPVPYSIKYVAAACAAALGLGLSVPEASGVTEVILDNTDLEMITEVSYTLKSENDTIAVSSNADITYVDIGGEYFAASFGNGATFPDAIIAAGYREDVVRSYWKAGASVIVGNNGAEMLYAEATSYSNDPFTISYEEGANFEGTETLREVLDDIAEATQTIYSVSGSDLVFKRLDRDGAAALRIARQDYFTLDSKTNRRLTSITSATELGDNVTASTGTTGTEQVMRDNAFLELREDIAALLDDAIERIGSITINQFELDWRGNFLLQIGDKLELETRDGGSAVAYLLDDSLSYNGGLQQRTRWSFEEGESESSNPNNLGEALKQTFARVDKANKQVDIVASESGANAAAIAALQLNTESINATVEEIKNTTVGAVDELSESVATLKQSVEASVTAESVSIAIKEELSNGVDKVETATGYKLDADGLEISKTGSEMATKITEDGMTVAKDGETVLTANNQGVNAQNLHATTFLIVGNSSRFEDYEKDGELRTGCFWIGGAS